MERFRIEIGRDDGVQPANIVGAIANEAGIEGKHIGAIEIEDTHSFVDLPLGMPREVFRDLKKVWICGKQLRISRLSDDTEGKHHGKPPQRDHKRREQGYPKGQPTGKGKHEGKREGKGKHEGKREGKREGGADANVKPVERIRHEAGPGSEGDARPKLTIGSKPNGKSRPGIKSRAKPKPKTKHKPKPKTKFRPKPKSKPE